MMTRWMSVMGVELTATVDFLGHEPKQKSEESKKMEKPLKTGVLGSNNPTNAEANQMEDHGSIGPKRGDQVGQNSQPELQVDTELCSSNSSTHGSGNMAADGTGLRPTESITNEEAQSEEEDLEEILPNEVEVNRGENPTTQTATTYVGETNIAFSAENLPPRTEAAKKKRKKIKKFPTQQEESWAEAETEKESEGSKTRGERKKKDEKGKSRQKRKPGLKRDRPMWNEGETLSNSITNSHIAHTNRTIELDSARKVAESIWEVGKAIGVTARGDDSELIERLPQMEELDRRQTDLRPNENMNDGVEQIDQ